MNSTGQKIRGEQLETQKSLVQSGNWTKMFPAKIESEVKSCTFVKKLITVALSNITYLCSMFPEEAYANRSVDGLSLKILREKNTCMEAKTLASWLLGAFDALEKKYLRELMLNIYVSQSNPDKVHEMYIFKFSYPEGKTTCQVLQGEGMKEVKNINSDDIYKSTQNLLRTLVVLTQGLDPLPESAFLAMKLAYFDEITPEDYEPAGFKAAELTDQEMSDGSQQLEVGELKTGHHSLKLKVYIAHKLNNDVQSAESKYDPKPLPVTGQGKEKDQQEDNIISSHLPSSPSSLLQRSQIKIVPDSSAISCPPASSVSLLQNSQSQSHYHVSSSQQKTKSPEPAVISCTCHNTRPDLLMLNCHYCGKRQHAACYRILEEEKIPDLHICVSCSINENIACTDPKLVKMSRKPAVFLTCIYRRVLTALLTTEFVNQEFICNNIGVTVDMTEQIILKLSAEKCIQDSGDGHFSVDMKTLKLVAIPKYLGVKKVSPLNSIVEKTEEMKIDNKENIDMNKGHVSCKRSDNDVEDNRPTKRIKGSRSKDNLSV